MLGLQGGRVLQFMQGIGNVAGHGDINNPLLVLPVKGEATVECADPVLGVKVICFGGLNDMLGVFGTSVLDTKVIHNKQEDSWMLATTKQARSMLGGEVAIKDEALLEEFVG
jgi:hypothetical protein